MILFFWKIFVFLKWINKNYKYQISFGKEGRINNLFQSSSIFYFLIQEIWMDRRIEHVNIEGYIIAPRTNRKEGINRGGIIILQQENCNGFIYIKNWEWGTESLLFQDWYEYIFDRQLVETWGVRVRQILGMSIEIRISFRLNFWHIN